MSDTRTLTDHHEIQAWADARGGVPSSVEATSSGDDVGIIRIDFPGYSGEGSLTPIGWDEWFQKFDGAGLALLVQEKTSAGERSHFNKLVRREHATARRAGGHP